jgi:hypothetical protein
MTILRTVSRVVLLGALLTMVGCGPSTTTATGKISFKGKPIVWGSVSVIASDGTTHQTGIEPDGTFTLKNVPTGSAKIGVSSPMPPTPGATRARGDDPRVSAPPPGPPAGAWVQIPDNLMDPSKSGLTITIKSGEPVSLDIP